MESKTPRRRNPTIKELQTTLTTLQQHAEASIQAKSHFLHTVARKLRGPLNHVLGMTQLLLSNNNISNQEKKDMLEIIFRSSNDMMMLVSEIQDYAGLDSGQLSIETKPVNLEDILEKTISICSVGSIDKKINLLLDYAESVPRYVKADPRRIRQIINNLIDNAIKFSNGGDIFVQVTQIDTNFAQIAVSDNGIGIPEPQLEQLLASLPDNPQVLTNSGYGLAVVKKLVHLMGGHLTAVSTLGKGSSFRFTLPLSTPIAIPEIENNPYNLQTIKVLLADENHSRANILAERLIAQNAQVTTLATDQALTALREGLHSNHPFQIVIISQQNFNPQAAYIARTIKATPALQDVMLVLAVISDLADYELDQALLSGYTCVTHSLHPSRFISELAMSWQSWSENGPAIKHAVLSLPKLLVVEDDTLSQKVAKLMLEDLGCQVDIANSGNKALHFLEEYAYNLVLMDIGLPDISGLEVASKFRQRERGSGNHTPIVALTSHSLEETANAIKTCGMDGYLAKPLLKEKLRMLLNQWVFKQKTVAA